MEMLSGKRVHKAAAATETEVRTRGGRHRDGNIGRYCRNGGSPMLLALQTPMYPPGHIIHIVRSRRKDARLV